jgi:DNA-binding CsgD family transcriptional regulator
MIQALIVLGIAAIVEGRYDAATASLEEALALAGMLPDARQAASLSGAALANLGVTAHALGDLAGAERAKELALAACRAAGSLRGEVSAHIDLGDVARDRGDVARAMDWYREGLRLAWVYGEQRFMANSLEELAAIAAGGGRAETAVRLYAAAARLRERTGNAIRVTYDQPVYERGMAAARAALDPAAFALAWDAGAALPLDQAVAEALDLAPAPAAGAKISPTPREAQILPLLVAGKTDREIGAALFLSRRTVENHVARLMSKLGVHTRAAAIEAARAAGLLPPAE